ncbi:MAG: hypothetical protein ACTS41_00515 [Candidatus Hodgkinia cicadicola]
MTAEVNVSLAISFENLFQSTTRKLIKHNQKLWIVSSGSNETHERFTWNDINKSYMLNLRRGEPLLGLLYKSMVTLTSTEGCISLN